LFFSDSSDQAVKKTKALMPSSIFVSELSSPAKTFNNKEENKKKIVEWCSTLKTETH